MSNHINESKKNSLVQWAKWKASNALAGMPEAKMDAILKNPVSVDGTCTFELDGQVMQTLTLGVHVVAEGEGYIGEPPCAVVVPGGTFRLGDVVNRKSLPRKTKPVNRVFPQ